MKNQQNEFIIKKLYDLKILSKETLKNITLKMETEKTSFIQMVIDEGVEFKKLANILKDSFNIESVESLENITLEKNLEIIDYDTAIKYKVIPLKKTDKIITVAIENPFDSKIIDDLELITNLKVIPVLVKSSQLKNFIDKNYSDSKISSIASQFLIDENLKKDIYTLDENQIKNIQNAPAVKLIDSLIESAVLLNASDIHIEPYEKIIRTRYRIDGKLKEFQSVDIILLPNIISRLKIMGTLDISEKRLPQDGHFKININNNKIDFRLSTMPTIHGEKAVIRMIYSQSDILSKEKLGFFKEDIEKIDLLLKNPYGAILVTGPTGSGKSTTISSFLKDLNKGDVNIVTIEDPVENIIHGINQININNKATLGFSNILRSVLRQDPDIIMIGEIRDNETAKIAIQASLTGHLVLSTLHTNDAISSIARLIDMGVEDFLLTTAINALISQRLVRKLCDNCKTYKIIDPKDAKIFNLSIDTGVYEPRGCNICGGSGYKGRFAVYELVFMDEILQTLVENKATKEEIKKTLKERGINTILDCILKNVILGNTSIFEMYTAFFC